MNLYWVETDDHHEDWFVVAPVPQEAEAFFESYEGYDDDTATARFVCDLDAKGLEVDWASEELLKSLGAEIQKHQNTRVVRLLGSTYAEGMLESIVRECDAIRRIRGLDQDQD